MAAGDRTLTLIVAGDPAQRTGGYRYDARIVNALRGRGWRVDVVGLAGRFPVPDRRARAEMARALAALPDGARLAIDGLAMGGLADVIGAHAHRLDLAALMHHPLADETGLDGHTRQYLLRSETRALAMARRVIVTSPFTARRLARLRVPPERITVVEPGVDPAPLAASSTAPEEPGRAQRLLCVATLTPRKGHAVLLEALSGMKDSSWQCECAGSGWRDPRHAATLFAAARDLGLDDRVAWLGEVDDVQLSSAYGRADLLVVPSHYEGYGMAVTEALARGVPVVATDGGALAETLPPAAGITVPADDAQALRGALLRWCEYPCLRRRLRYGARRYRARLTDWSGAGRAFALALQDGASTHDAEALS